MAVIQVDLDYNKMKEMKLDCLINDKKLIEAINSSNKDDLRDLILETVKILQDKYLVKFKHLYYAQYVYLGDELFDMFSSSCLEEIFNLFGYNTELIEYKDLGGDIIKQIGIKDKLEEFKRLNLDLWVGAMKIFNDNTEFYICAEESMHDSLIAIFVDTKKATYKSK